MQDSPAVDATTDVSRYSLGHVVERLQMQQPPFEIGGGFSEGLRDGWTTRYLGGIRYDASEFQRARGPAPGVHPRRIASLPIPGSASKSSKTST